MCKFKTVSPYTSFKTYVDVGPVTAVMRTRLVGRDEEREHVEMFVIFFDVGDGGLNSSKEGKPAIIDNREERTKIVFDNEIEEKARDGSRQCAGRKWSETVAGG